MTVAEITTISIPTPQQPIGRTSSSTELKVRLAQAPGLAEVHKIYEEVAKEHKTLCAWTPGIKLDLALLPTKLGEGLVYNWCTLESDGVKLIIDYLSNTHPGFTCYYCATKRELRVAITQMLKSNFAGKVAIIYKDGLHTISLLIEKTGTCFSICFDDSFGTAFDAVSSNQQISVRVAHVLKTISESRSSLDIQVYILDPKRQHTSRGCSVFSLHDVTQFFKMEHFFEELTRSPVETREIAIHPIGTQKIHYVHNLPPRLMRVTQSMTQIDEYIAQNSEERDETTSDAPCSHDLCLSVNGHKSFMLSLAFSTNEEEGKRCNMKLHDKLFRYLYIINKYMKRCSAQKLKEIADKYEISNYFRFLSFKQRLAPCSEQTQVYEIYRELAWEHTELCAEKGISGELDLADLPTSQKGLRYGACTLGTDGIKLIIDYLSKKIPQFTCYYCADLQELEVWIVQMVQSTFTGKVAIIYHYFGHTIALLLEKTETHLNICITGSLGYPEDEGTFRDIHQNIARIVSKLTSPLNIQLYSLYPKRQNSSRGCSVFSLHDATQFFYMEHFFEDLSASVDIDQIHYVYHLPPRLMRMAQSMKDIESYKTQNTQETHELHVSEGDSRSVAITPYDLDLSSNNHKSFTLSLIGSTYGSDTKTGREQRNMKSQNKLFRYIEVINDHYIKTHTLQELKNISAQYELSKNRFTRGNKHVSSST